MYEFYLEYQQIIEVAFAGVLFNFAVPVIVSVIAVVKFELHQLDEAIELDGKAIERRKSGRKYLIFIPFAKVGSLLDSLMKIHKSKTASDFVKSL